jgi:hypothetical protein
MRSARSSKVIWIGAGVYFVVQTGIYVRYVSSWKY